MEHYLTTQELSERIKMTPGTIRNLVCKKELKENIHYVKPTPRKLLFIWSSIESWLYGNSGFNIPNNETNKIKNISLINI
jgi:hypothetical protein